LQSGVHRYDGILAEIGGVLKTAAFGVLKQNNRAIRTLKTSRCKSSESYATHHKRRGFGTVGHRALHHVSRAVDVRAELVRGGGAAVQRGAHHLPLGLANTT